jgi:hypothetical protein
LEQGRRPVENAIIMMFVCDPNFSQYMADNSLPMIPILYGMELICDRALVDDRLA